jgi:hypothetical protein
VCGFSSTELEEATLAGTSVGTRGDRSARDLVDPNKFGAKFDLGDVVHFVEQQSKGKYVQFRVASAKRAAPKYDYIERGNVRVQVPHILSDDEVFASL